jgi:hypothetical protein
MAEATFGMVDAIFDTAEFSFATAELSFCTAEDISGTVEAIFGMAEAGWHGIFLGRRAASFSAPLLKRADGIVGNCIEVAMIGFLYYHELAVNSHEIRTRER